MSKTKLMEEILKKMEIYEHGYAITGMEYDKGVYDGLKMALNIIIFQTDKPV